MKTTKEKLIEQIVDSFWDMSSECPEDYIDMTNITLKEATTYLAERRAFERSAELDPEYCLPDEVTPELFMEAENCYIRYMKHKARILRLAEFLKDNTDPTAVYSNYREDFDKNSPDILPTDWLITEGFQFEMIDNGYPHALFLIELGQRSPKFNPNSMYCWYDREKNQLFSTDDPFADGVVDAEAFAEYILTAPDKECLKEILYFMPSEYRKYIFETDNEEAILND